MTYTEKVKLIREQLLLSQEEMAVKLGVSSVTVCRWETGKVEPSLKAKKSIRAFCEEHGINFEQYV